MLRAGSGEYLLLHVSIESMSRKQRLLRMAGAMAILASAVVPLSGGSDGRVNRVTRAMLCVTEGSLEEIPGERLSVGVPKMRGYVNRQTSQTIEASLTYVGPTKNETKLGSGQMRR